MCIAPQETMKTKVCTVMYCSDGSVYCMYCPDSSMYYMYCLPVLAPQVDLTSGVRLGPGVVRYKGQEPYRGIADGTTASENLSQVRQYSCTSAGLRCTEGRPNMHVEQEDMWELMQEMIHNPFKPMSPSITQNEWSP
jgi:hypothetical protein